ncbi:MAG TPA: dienelactone hydrolase family protein [Methylomirabilota bacterium]|jgi:carboxymethylenebutenolidase|nr:dienelactone hydrolase family protein [Methylomirabilota bacterium]
MAYEALFAETVLMRGHRNDQIDAYLARPIGVPPVPGVVVIHHMPGWDGPTKEIARRFAHHGYAAILPNLHFREGKATPEENSASIRAAGGMPDDRTMGDVQGAIDYLRTLPYLNSKVGVIGYCSGGRQSYLAACTLRGIDAAIDCYGGGVVAKPEELTPRQPVAPIEFTQNLGCPLLGLFGVEDTRPSPEDTKKTEQALQKFGKSYEFHTYDAAGHAFFAVDRPQYRQAAAIDGWQKVFAFFGKHLR